VGDVFTVNCKANPVLTVKRRRYRLRFLDASIARIYDLKLMSSSTPPVASKDTGRSGVKLQGQYQLPNGQQCMKMVQIASEGGLLPFPFLRDSVKVWPAKRREVIVDFSKYMDGTPTTKGDVIYLTNVLQMTNGRKPNEGVIVFDEETGKPLPVPIPDPDFDPDFRVPLMKIVIGDDAPDNSKDPLVYANGDCALKLDPTTKLPVLGMRALPTLPRSFKGFASRTFELQRSGGFGGETEWLINGLPFDETNVLAKPLQGAGELWIIKNGGGGWVHPMHLHEEEHRVISRNGVLAPTNAANPLLYNRTYRGQDHPDDIGKEDVVALDPGEEVVVWRKFRDFKGPYVAHCHNLAHEDHAMMFGWDIV
jgi:FtsP/CotA-like multicopper oxidase with cupredoxin domain